MGRPPINGTAMTAGERQRRWRSKRQKQPDPIEALREAWDACPKKQQTQFLQELRAARTAAKRRRRDQLVRGLAEKIRQENEQRGHVDLPLKPEEQRIVGWIGGLPIIQYGPAKPA